MRYHENRDDNGNGSDPRHSEDEDSNGRNGSSDSENDDGGPPFAWNGETTSNIIANMSKTMSPWLTTHFSAVARPSAREITLRRAVVEASDFGADAVAALVAALRDGPTPATAPSHR